MQPAGVGGKVIPSLLPVGRTPAGHVLSHYEASDHGQGLVEFALVAPMLLLLLIGILDAGIALNAYVTVSNASAEAAHYATVHPDADIDTIRSMAVVPHSQQLNTASNWLTLAGTYGNPPTNWTGGIPPSSPAVRVPIQMTVSYNWAAASIFLGGLLTRLFGANANFSATATSATSR